MLKTFLINFFLLVYAVLNIVSILLCSYYIAYYEQDIKLFFKNITVLQIIFYILTPIGFILSFVANIIFKIFYKIIYIISNSYRLNYKPFNRKDY